MIVTNIPPLSCNQGETCFLDPARLDDRGGIREISRKKKAEYHQSCCLMFNNTKLERARKTKPLSTQPVECQTKLCRIVLEGKRFFMCDKEAPFLELR